jgi:hypothetical protein
LYTLKKEMADLKEGFIKLHEGAVVHDASVERALVKHHDRLGCHRHDIEADHQAIQNWGLRLEVLENENIGIVSMLDECRQGVCRCHHQGSPTGSGDSGPAGPSGYVGSEEYVTPLVTSGNPTLPKENVNPIPIAIYVSDIENVAPPVVASSCCTPDLASVSTQVGIQNCLMLSVHD